MNTSQKSIETVKPNELTGKRLEAFRTVMKATASNPKSLITVYDKLTDIYKTKKTRKKCLKIFDKSPEIPIEVTGQTVYNKA